MWRMALHSKKLFLVGKVEEERRGRIVKNRRHVLFGSDNGGESNCKSTATLVLIGKGAQITREPGL